MKKYVSMIKSGDNLLLSSSVVSRGLFSVTQLVATSIATIKMDTNHLAIYFTFLSVLAMQFIFELGISQVLVIDISRCEKSKLQDQYFSNQESVLLKLYFWQYCKYGLQFFIFCVVAGYLVLSNSSIADHSNLHWVSIWIFTVLIYALRFLLLYIEAIIEGRGGIQKVISVRILSQFVWIFAFISNIFAWYPLASLAVAMMTAIACSFFIYRFDINEIVLSLNFKEKIPSQVPVHRLDNGFKTAVSISWIASFCITNAPVPISLWVTGPAFAATLGIIGQFAAVIGVISGALSSPRMAKASTLASASDWQHYYRLYKATVQICGIATIATCAVALVVLVVVEKNSSLLPIENFPSAVSALPFLLTSVIYSYMSAISIFYRALGKEVFVLPLSAMAVVIIITYSIIAPIITIFEVGSITFIITSGVVIPFIVKNHLQMKQRNLNWIDIK